MVQYKSELDRAFAALADPTRRGILRRVGAGSATITELAEPFGMSLTGLKKHVRILEDAGLLTTEKSGRARRCSLGPRPLEDAQRWIETYGEMLDARLDRLGELLRENREGREEGEGHELEPMTAMGKRPRKESPMTTATDDHEATTAVTTTIEDQEETMAAATTLTTPADREILSERVFDAPRERVFATYTDPQLIPEWWGPRRMTTVVEEMDPRPGGRWRFLTRDTDGREHRFSGVYRELAPPERLVQTFEWDGKPGHVIVETTTFEDLGERTRVSTTSLFHTTEERDDMLSSGMEEGLTESHERFAELLARTA
jgi:uncharacterized protein YndB with AHSA1/START domain/DNA-binding transcriptional ArsR family regulator